MRFSRLVRLIPSLAGLTAAIDAWPQEPFDLDLEFSTQIDVWNVNSVMVMEDGRLIISGRIKFPGESFFRGSARLLPNGERDLAFPPFPQSNGGGKLTGWQDRSYVSLTSTVRRLDPEGLIDLSFIDMNDSPYFSSFQGGDYHVSQYSW